MTRPPRPPQSDQATSALKVIRAAIGESIVGVYLYGSATQGGLRPRSDLDLLAVVDAPLREGARRKLTEGLMKISGTWPPRGSERPLEVTVVNRGDVVPWRYPPRREFVYGEWLRNELEVGAFSPHAEDPDLAILLRMARGSSIALMGPDASRVLDPIPEHDVRRAMIESVPRLLSELPGDERNVLLTLARIWVSLETNRIMTKDDAAAWAIERLPAEDRGVLETARAAYLGLGSDAEGYTEAAVRVVSARMADIVGSYRP